MIGRICDLYNSVVHSCLRGVFTHLILYIDGPWDHALVKLENLERKKLLIDEHIFKMD
jgi:hypothetical protein